MKSLLVLPFLAAALAAAPATNDLFSRTTSSGWGSTPQGQAYTVSGGTASDFSVGSNRGAIKLSTVSNRLARLPLSVTNYEGTVRVALTTVPSANYAFAGAAARIQSSGSDYYYFRLKHATGGAVTLTIQKIIAGSQTVLSSEVRRHRVRGWHLLPAAILRGRHEPHPPPRQGLEGRRSRAGTLAGGDHRRHSHPPGRRRRGHSRGRPQQLCSA